MQIKQLKYASNAYAQLLTALACLPLRFVSLLVPWWLKPWSWRRIWADLTFYARVIYIHAYTSSARALHQPPLRVRGHPLQPKQDRRAQPWKLAHMVEWMDEVGTILLWMLFLGIIFFLSSVPLLCIITQLVVLFNRIFATPAPPRPSAKAIVIEDENDAQYGMRKRGHDKSTISSSNNYLAAPSLTEEEALRYEELIHSPVAQNLRMVAILPHRIAVAIVERFLDYVRYRVLKPRH